LKSKKLTIAIDGFSACGKSTLAKDLAKELRYIFIDSGAMYRGVSLFALRNDLIVNGTVDISKLLTLLDRISLSFRRIGEDDCLFLNGENVSEEIRQAKVADVVSKVAAVKEVRQKLVAEQRLMGENGGIIMDGRDIASVVFPNAELKIFVTAHPDIRVQRRFLELKEKGIELTLEEVKKNLEERDYLDTHRAESPLIQVSDARVLDNSELTKSAQLTLVKEWVDEILQKL
jgi:CMP/dCMP kinase